MLDSRIKSIIDTARDVLVGKVPNPQSQIDLITIAMIYKFMDDMDNSVVKNGGKPSFFNNTYDENLSKEKNDEQGNINLEPYAWSKLLSTSLGNEARINLYSEALERLQLAKQIPELFRRIFKGAFLPFRDGATLTMFLKEINQLSYDNSENLGNGFEYLLSIMGSQGDAGQFRTPRHIIDFIVDAVNPQKDDTILDPACGTAGFLISAFKHILKHNSEAFDEENEVKAYASKVAKSAEKVDIQIENQLNGDKLSHSERMNLTKNIKGYDISPDMQKLALVNLYLHGFRNPDIIEYDTLTNETKWDDNFDVILANPPFMTPKGGIKPHKKFAIQANRSEVLFVDYIIEHLNLKGKAGIIVPEGIVFQSQTAYKKLRKKLVDEGYLYAAVSLPSGVFQPYSGVKTSILLIDREIAKRTKDILFVDVKNDGFDLGAQRRAIKENDLLQAFEAIKEYQLNHYNPELVSESLKQYNIANLVPKTRIAEGEEYNLAGSRYVETVDYSNCKWDMVKIGDVCDVRDGTHDSPKPQQSGYPLVTSKNLVNGTIDFDNVNLISEEDHINICKRSHVDDGDILYAMIGTIGNPVVVKKYRDFSIKNVALFKVGKNNPKLNNSFLKYILERVTEDFNNKAVGGTQKFVSLKFLREYEIPLPPLKVQEEIVKELDSYQAVIDGAKKVVENWKPTIPINPNWKKIKLGDICEFEYGKPLKQEDRIEGEYPVWGSNGIVGYHNNYFVDKPYIVVGRKGSAGAVNFSTESGTPIDTTFFVRERTDKYDIKYLYYQLGTLGLDKINKQAGVPGLNRNDAYRQEFYFPSLEEQKEIVAKIEIEEQAIEQCKNLIKIQEEKIASKIKSIWGEDCE